ncbi:MAG: nitroreductase family protein [Flavobacteriales bacterium]|nr:nitroreductase family protein [Flavobacteriales bacterium]
MESRIDLINEIIRNRRTVKPEKYSTKIIDKKIIEDIVENAKWAPTHGLTQPWCFKVFYGKGLESFGDFHAELYRASVAPEMFKQKKFDQFKDGPRKSSALIAICLKRQESEKIAEIEEIEAIACAVHNMHLTATAHGIVCYWGTGGKTYSEEMKTYLGLGEKDRVLGLFHLGYPEIEWPTAVRKPASDYCVWIEE